AMAACLTSSNALDSTPGQVQAAASMLPNEGLPLGALDSRGGLGILFPARQIAAISSTGLAT
ncbi:hypothetical protein PMIN07_011203, partial [Paraphaeosphaeria minitans]